MKLKALTLVRLSQRGRDYRKAHPIVFDWSAIPDDLPVTDTPAMIKERVGGNFILDCPFEMFTMEFAMPDEPLFELCPVINGEEQGLSIYVECVLCQELSIGNYCFDMLLTSNMDRTPTVIRVTEGDTAMSGWDTASLYLKLLDTTRMMLKAFHEREKGRVQGEGSIGYKLHGRRRSYAPRDVVYVGTREQKKFKAKAATGEPVNWSHVWQVMGHWRKIGDSSLGVDREGNRTEYGRTWIRPFTKGKGKLIEKTRVLK